MKIYIAILVEINIKTLLVLYLLSKEEFIDIFYLQLLIIKK